MEIYNWFVCLGGKKSLRIKSSEEEELEIY